MAEKQYKDITYPDGLPGREVTKQNGDKINNRQVTTCDGALAGPFHSWVYLGPATHDYKCTRCGARYNKVDMKTLTDEV